MSKTFTHPLFMFGILDLPSGDKIKIDQEFAKQLIENFKTFQELGYNVRVLNSHARGTNLHDIYTYGDVVGMTTDEQGIHADVQWSRKEEEEADEQGLFREWSPGFALNFNDPHNKHEFDGPVLIEFSFCATGWQRNLKAKLTEEELSMAKQIINLSNDEEKQELNMEARLDELEGSVEELRKIVEDLIKSLEVAPEELDDTSKDDDKDEEKEELSRRIRQLEDDNVRLSLKGAGITDAKTVDHLVKLNRVSPELFKAQVELSAKTVQSPIGSTGVTTSSDVSKLAVEAFKKSGLPKNRFVSFLSSNYPEQVANASTLIKLV